MPTSPSIQQAFRQLVESLSTHYEPRESRSIATILFADVFEVRNVQRQDVLSAPQVEQLNRMSERLLRYEPLQYVLGQADFFGLKFKVNPSVLIPRPETEELVALVLERWEERWDEKRCLLDIGTGTGCIPLSLKRYRTAWEVWGYDVSPAALEVAAQNAQNLDLELHLAEVDILDQSCWPARSFDLIISNPPYIPPSERRLMPPQVLRYEPELALFVPEAEADIFYHRILAFAERHLRTGGQLFFECNEYRAEAVLGYALEAGWTGQLEKDMSGKLRMLCLRREVG